MDSLRHIRLFALGAVAAIALTACSTAAESGSDTSASAPSSEAPTTEPATEAPTEDMTEASEAALPATDLRITLERQLGHHAILAVDAMRAGVQGDADFEAAAAALNRNTEDLTESVTLAYGEEGGRAFNEMWSNHIDLFVNYTVATAENDDKAKAQAVKGLDQYRQDFGSFLETATEGGVQADAVAGLLQDHVNQLTTQIDAFANGNFKKAYNQERQAYAHMFMTAKALAGAISGQMPDRFPGDAATAGADLRSTLGQLLGEHAALAVDAMRAGVTGADRFEQAAAALEGNTEDLTAAIDSVYGAEGAETFNTLWSQHIGFFVDYTVATAEGDDDGREQALERLQQYKEDFSGFLETATGGEVPADGAAEALQMHVDQLVTQVDQYAEEDFAKAYGTGYEAYSHMYDTAAVLAAGISAQMPEQFGVDGAGTASEGMDHASEEATE